MEMPLAVLLLWAARFGRHRAEKGAAPRVQCAGSSSGWARDRLREDRGKSPTDTGLEGLGSAAKRCPGWRQI